MCFNEKLIRSAFDWPIGDNVWLKREKEYLKWYNSDDRPMSWEEYCEQNPLDETQYWIDYDSEIIECTGIGIREAKTDVNIMSKELCEAFIAYMKLIQLRNAWVNNLVECVMSYRIITYSNRIEVRNVGYHAQGLSFPNRIIAREFIDTFKDLLETAKPLL